MIINQDDAGQRIDRWLKKHFEHLSFGQVQKLLRTGQVRMDGKRLKPDSRLIEGAEIRLPPTIEPTPKAEQDLKDAAFIQSLVIYDDGQMVAINKPVGLAVQGGSKISRHVDGMLDGLISDNGTRPRLVHRLDKDTSGVLLLARSAPSARKLGALFAEQCIEKTYIAITCPAPKADAGRIDAALAKGSKGEDLERMFVEEGEGKAAITDYRVLGRSADNKSALVAFYPQTGRMHQIRAHAAHLGAPLLGDVKYGGQKANRLFLHAKTLAFTHIKTGSEVVIEADLPQAFEMTCEKLEILQA